MVVSLTRSPPLLILHLRIPYRAANADMIVSFTDPIETLTTYYIAPYYALTPGSLPTGPVEAVICRRRGCSTAFETWGIATATGELAATASETVYVGPQEETGVSFSLGFWADWKRERMTELNID